MHSWTCAFGRWDMWTGCSCGAIFFPRDAPTWWKIHFWNGVWRWNENDSCVANLVTAVNLLRQVRSKKESHANAHQLQQKVNNAVLNEVDRFVAKWKFFSSCFFLSHRLVYLAVSQYDTLGALIRLLKKILWRKKSIYHAWMLLPVVWQEILN